jgi:hypothetical protein
MLMLPLCRHADFRRHYAILPISMPPRLRHSPRRY